MNIYALAWTALAGIGWLVSLYLSVEAVRDLRSLGLITNGRRKRVWARLASEVIRLIIHSMFIGLGVFALGRDFGLTPFVIAFFVFEILMLTKSFISVYVAGLEPSRGTQAEAAARDLIATARIAAEEIVSVAEAAAAHLKISEVVEPLEVRKAEAAERTADATEKIAEQNGQ